MKTPKMPTVDEFLEATTVRVGGKLGFTKLGPVLSRERLTFIDMELFNWWNQPESNYDKKMASTLRLMKWCSDWAQKHRTNKGATRTGAQRMIAIENLVEQCRLTIGMLNTKRGLRSLGDDYKAERKGYKDAKSVGQKINPVGGSYIHNAKAPSGLQGSAAQAFAKPMAQMTPEDYKLIAEALLPPEKIHEATTLYMNSDERAGYILTVKGGQLCDAAGEPIKRELVYAMSKYGNMYGIPIGRAAQWGDDDPTGFFNHSSFLAGKDVICAGTIQKAANWDVGNHKAFVGKWMITTSSGHYKPTPDHLKNCLKSLAMTGLNLADVGAYYIGPNDSKTFVPAADFVR